MSLSYLHEWANAFALTQLLEMPVYWFAFAPRPTWQRLGFGFAASAITHPFVWFFFPFVLPFGYEARVAVSELFAWGVEAVWLARLGVPRAMSWSLAAHGLSFGVGLVLQACWNWP